MTTQMEHDDRTAEHDERTCSCQACSSFRAAEDAYERRCLPGQDDGEPADTFGFVIVPWQ